MCVWACVCYALILKLQLFLTWSSCNIVCCQLDTRIQDTWLLAEICMKLLSSCYLYLFLCNCVSIHLHCFLLYGWCKEECLWSLVFILCLNFNLLQIRAERWIVMSLKIISLPLFHDIYTHKIAFCHSSNLVHCEQIKKLVNSFMFTRMRILCKFADAPYVGIGALERSGALNLCCILTQRWSPSCAKFGNTMNQLPSLLYMSGSGFDLYIVWFTVLVIAVWEKETQICYIPRLSRLQSKPLLPQQGDCSNFKMCDIK